MIQNLNRFLKHLPDILELLYYWDFGQVPKAYNWMTFMEDSFNQLLNMTLLPAQ